MRIPSYMRVGAVVGATASLFWLPWGATLTALFLAGLVFPPIAFALGILADILYYPGIGLPWGTVYGLLIAVLSALVRHFVKTSIM